MSMVKVINVYQRADDPPLPQQQQNLVCTNKSSIMKKLMPLRPYPHMRYVHPDTKRFDQSTIAKI